MRGQLIPALGRVPLQSLTPQHVARAYAELAAPREVTVSHARARRTMTRTRSAASLRYAHAILHGALEQAVVWRLIERNPAVGAALPRRSRPDAAAHARRGAALAGRRAGPSARGAVRAGANDRHASGRAARLRWRDVDWTTRRVAVHHTLVRLHGRWWLGEPKTAKSERSIDLTDPTIDVLRGHRARQAERMLALGHPLTDDDLIFCDASGEPLWGRHVTTLSFKALLREAGLPPIRFHDLRHTFATLQLTAGTNPKIVSEVLGHKEVAITLDRYSHALPTLQAEAMGRLDAVLGRSPLDRPAAAPDETTELWVDEDPQGSSAAATSGDKGPDKGPDAPRRPTKRPDPRSDRAGNGEFGTAYRIPSETSHASQPRAPSTKKRRMRRMSQEG